MNKSSRFYWDSCVWIALLNEEIEKGPDAGLIYEHAKDGKCELWTSVISINECRRLKTEEGKSKPYKEENSQIICSMFHQPFIKLISLTHQIAEESTKIWRTTEVVHYRDIIHLVSAKMHNINVMNTYDEKHLIPLDGRFECGNGEKLKISRPDGAELQFPLIDTNKKAKT